MAGYLHNTIHNTMNGVKLNEDDIIVFIKEICKICPKWLKIIQNTEEETLRMTTKKLFPFHWVK